MASSSHSRSLKKGISEAKQAHVHNICGQHSLLNLFKTNKTGLLLAPAGTRICLLLIASSLPKKTWKSGRVAAPILLAPSLLIVERITLGFKGFTIFAYSAGLSSFYDSNCSYLFGIARNAAVNCFASNYYDLRAAHSIHF